MLFTKPKGRNAPILVVLIQLFLVTLGAAAKPKAASQADMRSGQVGT